jgi:hypothetical protein
MSKKTPIAKIRSDGTVVEVLDKGIERPFPDTLMRPMTEAEIETAAAADPDARPMTAEELRAAKRVPRTKTFFQKNSLILWCQFGNKNSGRTTDTT